MASTITTATELQAVVLGDRTPTNNQLTLLALARAAAEGKVRNFLEYNPVQEDRTEVYPTDRPEHGSGSGHGTLFHGHWDSDGSNAFRTAHHRPEAHKLQVRHIPIRSITAIHEDRDARAGTAAGAFGAATLLAATTYFMDLEGTQRNVSLSGVIYRDNTAWSTVLRSIQVRYTAGYTAQEFMGLGELDASPIKHATLLLGSWLYSQLRSRQGSATLPDCTGIETERLGDYMYKLNADVARRLGLLEGGLPEAVCSCLEPYQHLGHLVI